MALQGTLEMNVSEVSRLSLPDNAQNIYLTIAIGKSSILHKSSGNLAAELIPRCNSLDMFVPEKRFYDHDIGNNHIQTEANAIRSDFSPRSWFSGCRYGDQ